MCFLFLMIQYWLYEMSSLKSNLSRNNAIIFIQFPFSRSEMCPIMPSHFPLEGPLVRWSVFITFKWLKNLCSVAFEQGLHKQIAITKAIPHHQVDLYTREKPCAKAQSDWPFLKIEVSLTITHHVYMNIIYIDIFEDIHIIELFIYLWDRFELNFRDCCIILIFVAILKFLTCIQMHSVLYKLWILDGRSMLFSRYWYLYHQTNIDRSNKQ